MQTVKPGGRPGLVLHPRSDPTAVVEKLTSWARSHGKQLVVDDRDAARVPDDVEPVSEAQLRDEADALISLDGDGTMLGALRLVAQRPIPIVGVNLGSQGVPGRGRAARARRRARPARHGRLHHRGTQRSGAKRWMRRVDRVQRHQRPTGAPARWHDHATDAARRGAGRSPDTAGGPGGAGCLGPQRRRPRWD